MLAANSEKTGSNRGKGRPFVSGQSGNPSGRPKLKPEQKDALEKIRELSPKAVETLERALRGKSVPWAVKIRAAEMILERTYGKPEAVASVQIETQSRAIGQMLDQLTDEQLEAYQGLCGMLNAEFGIRNSEFGIKGAERSGGCDAP